MSGKKQNASKKYFYQKEKSTAQMLASSVSTLASLISFGKKDKHYVGQWCISNIVKHLRWGVLRKQLVLSR